MVHRLIQRKGIHLAGLVVALAAILVSGGILAACSRAQTTTSAPAPTTTSAPAQTTTLAPTATTTSTAPRTTTSAPTPTGVNAADFYKANVVTIVVPYGPGGSNDLASRLIANYWAELTGGRMIIENKPGAGGLLGANYAYAAKPDGLTIGSGIIGPALITPTLAHDPAVKFDIKKINWIGLLMQEGRALGISAKLPYTSMENLTKSKGLKFASSSPSGSLAHALIIELFGLPDARIVLGYGGVAEAFLAVAKGEVDAYVTTPSNLLDAVDKGFIKRPVLSMGFKRITALPDAPVIPELLKLSPHQESLLQTEAALGAGVVLWFGPGVPQDRIDFVRNTIAKILADENFLKQAKVYWPVWVPPVIGNDLAAEMDKELTVATPETLSELLKLVDKYAR